MDGGKSRLIRKPCLGISHDGVADRNLAYCDQGIDKYPNGSMSISLETDYGFAYRR